MNLADISRAVDERLGATICAASTLVADRAMGRSRALGQSIGGNDRLSTGWADVDAVLGGGLPRGGLHEWCGVAAAEPTDSTDDEPVGDDPISDRSISDSRKWIDSAQWFAPVCILAHLAGRVMAHTPNHAIAGSTMRGAASRWIVWVGQRCFAHPAILVDHQHSDHRLLERSLFVRADGVKDRLHAIDLALRSPVIEAVIADGSRLDMAATRRIQLLAKSHQKPALLARPARERNHLSAAQSRWLVRWRPCSLHRTGCEPKPQWNVQLLRCKAMPIGSATRNWMVEWDHATSAVCLSSPLAGSADQTAATTGEAKHRTARRQSA